jgi:DNA-binding MarR family transcriptional regulator
MTKHEKSRADDIPQVDFVEESLRSDADYDIWRALTRARDSVFRARALELAYYDLSPIETLALFLVRDAREKPTPAELSRWMLRRHNSVSGLLRRMEARGLLEKSRDSKKGNVWRVHLTGKGKAACLGATKISALHTVMSSLSRNQKEALVRSLNKITEGALSLVNRTPYL